MDDIRHLVQIYLDDRQSLSEEELQRLAEAARRSRSLAVELKEQLVLDELLAQSLAIDRRDFRAQVYQRLSDSQLANVEGELPADPLRRPAPPPHASGPLGKLRNRLRTLAAVAAGVLLLVSLACVYAALPQWRELARIESVQGDVKLMRNDATYLVRSPLSLRAGDIINVPQGASVVVMYDDGTRLRIHEHSRVRVLVDRLTWAKRVHLETGHLNAQVAPQRWKRTMVVTTPKAAVHVLGTEFSLWAGADEFQIDVIRGQLQVVRSGDRDPHLLAAGQRGRTDDDRFWITEARWPSSRRGLVFGSSGDLADDLTLVSTVGGQPQYLLDRRGLVWLDRTASLVLAGGRLLVEDSAELLRHAGSRHDAFTLEAVIESAGREQVARIVTTEAFNNLPNFSLEQHHDRLVFRLVSGDESPQTTQLEIGRISSDRVHHVAVAFVQGRAVGMLDGETRFQISRIDRSLRAWREQPLLIGEPEEGAGWRGKVHRVALYHRALSEEELRRNSQLILESPELNVERNSILVRAKRMGTPRYLQPFEEFSHRPTLVLERFEVLEVLQGSLAAGELRAVHWDLVDTHHPVFDPSMPAVTLALEPLRDHPQVTRHLTSAEEHAIDPVAVYFIVDWQ